MGEYDTKRSKAAATAGPSQDDRFGAGKVATDLLARIIKFDVVSGTPMITIASGTTHGTRAHMTGYIKAGADGVLAEFQIVQAKQGISYAFPPELDAEDLHGHLNVVINPTSAPQQAAIGLWTRVIHVESVPLGTRITIPRGKAHGIIPGTPGTLRSTEGRGSFVINEARLTRSTAIVDEPVDFVTANQDVVLNRLSPKERGMPVQRRAAGKAEAVDARATAKAGVAGAASQLPFFDVIQRSFGKHDISGIRARIGGDATAASQALGARAYATGNTVAFASAPDLHTAAHEAAHTVQQARGAVTAQGLGAADDKHERHADAVADAVVAGRSAEPLLDVLTGGGSASTAIQRAPSRSKRAGLQELHAARDAAKLVDEIAVSVPKKLAALQAARELADPSAIRRAASELMQARALLEMSSITIREGVRAAAPADGARLQATLQTAQDTIPSLADLPERALQQASALQRAKSGSLVDLPQEEAPTTPEETRQRAAKLAPLGLCDDVTMQHAQSRACPLDVQQRLALRTVVGAGLTEISTNWLSAIGDSQLNYRLKPLFEKAGLSPYVTILLGAISWLGPIAAGFLRQRHALAAAETVADLADLAIAKKGPSEEEKFLFGLVNKMMGAVFARGGSKPQPGERLFDAARVVEALWHRIAAADIVQLPDPVLVALGEGLQASPYSLGFFREKLTKLVEGYEALLQVGQRTDLARLDQLPLQAVRVRHPTGVERIALARPAVKSVPNHSPKLSAEPGDDSYTVKNGNYIFHSWIDRALAGLAGTSGTTPLLASDDARWRTERDQPAVPDDLARWHDDPTKTNDVNLLARPANPFVPKGSK